MDTEWKLRVEKLGYQYIVVAIRENTTTATYSIGQKPQPRTTQDKRYWTGMDYVKEMYIYKCYEYESENDAVSEMQILERDKIYPMVK